MQTSNKNVVFVDVGIGGCGGLFFAGTVMISSFKAQSAFRQQPHVQAIPTERKNIEPIAFNILGF